MPSKQRVRIGSPLSAVRLVKSDLRPSRTRTSVRRPATAIALGAAWLVACSEPSSCGPARARVERVIDGDTIELTSGERIRYLLVDTPESGARNRECYGLEARDFNRSLVEGREVTLRYDEECKDPYDRLLAYVSVGDREVNSLLVERGYACVLHIPPNGAGRARDFEALEAGARQNGRGLWRCETKPCR